ncbi:MAG: hypothetical protein AXA67_10855 [Methylothermaceae bacteria B42]|nr:MAG: hypothetical protein AXA67_10855 [Methylothermaceae bacteria B42]HHJ38975.1 aminoacyl-tRNA deacylase [Methylothermaceae bacterium]
MTEQLSSPVTQLLEQWGIAYEWVEIPLDPDKKPVRSLEELVQGRGQKPEQIVRSLLFRAGGGGFALLGAPGNAKADWAALRKALGERRLTMADMDEVLAATGYPVGAVPPIALPGTVRQLMDESVFDHDKVIIGSGVLGYALELRSEDLRKAAQNAAIGKFVK